MVGKWIVVPDLRSDRRRVRQLPQLIAHRTQSNGSRRSASLGVSQQDNVELWLAPVDGRLGFRGLL